MRAMIVLFASLLQIGGAFAFDSPKALLEAAYARYFAAEFPEETERYYSTGLVHKMIESTAAWGDEVGPIDFDIFINGQDYDLKDLVIGEPLVAGDNASVNVSFSNFDRESLLAFSFVREADGWFIDDAASLSGDDRWLLSNLLTQVPEPN